MRRDREFATVAVVLILLLGSDSRGETAPGTIADLVSESNRVLLVTAVSAALDSTDPAVRAAASRVALVRSLSDLVPKLRDVLAHETDLSAAREEARAIVLDGTPGDVDEVIRVTRAMPAGMNIVIARALSRRSDALDLLSKLHAMHYSPDVSFMTQALWQRPLGLAVVAGSRFVGARDAAGWRALLGALRESALAMNPNVIGASLDSPSEEIRTTSVWYLVHGYSPDPSKLPEILREALGSPKEVPSVREAYGRELLRRMTGGRSQNDPNWLEWLRSPEADELIASETALFEYFTDEEFITRKHHCDLASNECHVPAAKNARIPSKAVRQPDFELPSELPPGLADSVIRSRRCRNGWFGVAAAVADASGRVVNTLIRRVDMDDRCAAAADELMKLSLATPASIVAPAETSDILLMRAAGADPCLDEPGLTDADLGLRQIGGDVTAPIVKRRVEPYFPPRVVEKMGHGTDVIVIVACVISRAGCVRSIRLVAQSPFPELNGAALTAISQWQFLPARLHGIPVDAIFNLSIRFRT